MSTLEQIYALAEPYWQTRSNEIHVPGVLRAGAAAAGVATRRPTPTSSCRRSCCTTAATSSCPRRTTSRGWPVRPSAGSPTSRAVTRSRARGIAGEILEQVGYDPARIDLIQEIVDGHDSRTSAVSLDDAIVKDADKLWRFTESGVRICHVWMDRTPEDFMDFVESRIDAWLLTDAGRELARETLAESRCASW